jgi:hypothetical protein
VKNTTSDISPNTRIESTFPAIASDGRLIGGRVIISAAAGPAPTPKASMA